MQEHTVRLKASFCVRWCSVGTASHFRPSDTVRLPERKSVVLPTREKRSVPQHTSDADEDQLIAVCTCKPTLHGNLIATYAMNEGRPQRARAIVSQDEVPRKKEFADVLVDLTPSSLSSRDVS